jgi:uncharacterized membrane protein YfcA
VPGLVFLLAMDQRRAHGTSLAAIVPIAISGVAGFVLGGAVDWTAAATVGAGSIVGSVIGTDALHRISQRVLRLAFIGFLLLTALHMMMISTPDVAGRGELDALMILGLVALGVVSGTLAGLLGVGGGIVIVPLLVAAFLVPDATAKGTSLVVIVPTAVTGTVRNVRNGNADLFVAMVVGSAGVLFAFVGSRIALEMDPRTSSVSFALLLLALAGRMSVIAWRERRAPGRMPQDRNGPHGD